MSQVLSPLLVGVNLFVLGQSSITTYTKANRHKLNELSGNPKKVWPYNVQIYWNALNGWGGGAEISLHRITRASVRVAILLAFMPFNH